MSDTSSTGQLVRRHFDSVIRSIASEPVWWEFDQVTDLANNPSYVKTTNLYDYEFDIPANNGIKGVWDTNQRTIEDYDIQTNKLYCDHVSIYLRYVKLNVTAFPEYIGNCMVYALAAAMAKSGEGGTSRRELTELYRMWSSKARKISNNQRRPRTYGLDEPYSYLTVRGSSRRRSDFPPATFGP